MGLQKFIQSEEDAQTTLDRQRPRIVYPPSSHFHLLFYVFLYSH
jgi:hypothetical protein